MLPGGPGVVRCAAVPAPAGVDVALDDGDDGRDARRGSAAGSASTPTAGAGADRLDAAAVTGYVELLGGEGADQLLAGTGESELTGGPAPTRSSAGRTAR